jgi:hypothetical protein
MSHDIVLYVSEENNCRLIYRSGIESGCANLTEQLLVLDQSNNKCAGLWFNTTDYETPFNSAVKELVAATPDSLDHALKLKKLFIVLLESGYSSTEVALKLSPLLLKNHDLAWRANQILQETLKKAEHDKENYQQYIDETTQPAMNWGNFQDSLIALIKNLLTIVQTSLFSTSGRSTDIKTLSYPTSDQFLFFKLHKDALIENRNRSPEDREAFDRALGIVPYSGSKSH